MVISLGFAKFIMRIRFSSIEMCRINWWLLVFYRSTQPTGTISSQQSEEWLSETIGNHQQENLFADG